MRIKRRTYAIVKWKFPLETPRTEIIVFVLKVIKGNTATEVRIAQRITSRGTAV